MKIEPSFPDHWKTKRLLRACGHGAITGLLRLWGHAQTRREFAGLELTPEKLAGMMDYEGDKQALWDAMTDPAAPWLDKGEDGTWTVHGFEEHNRQLVHLWGAGKRGGRKAAAPPTTPLKPSNNTDRTRLDANANHLVGICEPYGNHLDLPVRKAWSLEEVSEAGSLASIKPEVCKLYHDSREAVGWVDRNGNPIRSMSHDLAKFAAHHANIEAQGRNGHKNGSSGPLGAKKQPSVWELRQQLEAAEKEAERIAANPANKTYDDATFQSRLKPEAAAQVKALRARMGEIRQQLAGAKGAA